MAASTRELGLPYLYSGVLLMSGQKKYALYVYGDIILVDGETGYRNSFYLFMKIDIQTYMLKVLRNKTFPVRFVCSAAPFVDFEDSSSTYRHK